jgi:hypothetical protein
MSTKQTSPQTNKQTRVQTNKQTSKQNKPTNDKRLRIYMFRKLNKICDPLLAWITSAKRMQKQLHIIGCVELGQLSELTLQATAQR